MTIKYPLVSPLRGRRYRRGNIAAPVPKGLFCHPEKGKYNGLSKDLLNNYFQILRLPLSAGKSQDDKKILRLSVRKAQT